MYVQGTHGLTTDYAHDASNFVVKLNTPKQLNATAGQALEIPGEIQTQVGSKSSYIFKICWFCLARLNIRKMVRV